MQLTAGSCVWRGQISRARSSRATGSDTFRRVETGGTNAATVHAGPFPLPLHTFTALHKPWAYAAAECKPGRLSQRGHQPNPNANPRVITTIIRAECVGVLAGSSTKVLEAEAVLYTGLFLSLVPHPDPDPDPDHAGWLNVDISLNLTRTRTRTLT